jgi:hypothetical protein
LIGRSFSAAIDDGALFKRTLYSCDPTFAVPPGRIRFCALMAVDTSAGESFSA